MVEIKKFKILCFLLLIVMIILFFPTWTPSIKNDNSISVLEQVEINGSNHEIMIRGNNRNNPIIIFVHGGPASSEIPYVRKYQDLLEKDFTVVHYDQRGSGKSYHFFEDYTNLSTDLLVEDLHEITDYITNWLEQEKVILIGHSFGTYIATIAAYEVPEKYSAYIGIGQVSDRVESESDSLEYCINQAKISNNAEDVKYLKGLTEKIKSGEMLTPRSYIRKYGGASRLINDDGDYIKGFLFSSEYNILDVFRYFKGVGISQDLLLNDSEEKPLPKYITEFKLPFYFIMGKYDCMTSTKAAKKYYDSIKSEYSKEFIVYEESAHYPQFEEKEKFYKWMSDMFVE